MALKLPIPPIIQTADIVFKAKYELDLRPFKEPF